jgi:hypothetical protein
MKVLQVHLELLEVRIEVFLGASRPNCFRPFSFYTFYDQETLTP